MSNSDELERKLRAHAYRNEVHKATEYISSLERNIDHEVAISKLHEALEHAGCNSNLKKYKNVLAKVHDNIDRKPSMAGVQWVFTLQWYLATVGKEKMMNEYQLQHALVTTITKACQRTNKGILDKIVDHDLDFWASYQRGQE